MLSASSGQSLLCVDSCSSLYLRNKDSQKRRNPKGNLAQSIPVTNSIPAIWIPGSLSQSCPSLQGSDAQKSLHFCKPVICLPTFPHSTQHIVGALFFFFKVLGLELRAYILSHSPALFVLCIFEIGSCKLFAWAGFEPRSSWSLPSE
jgi:hypothetical protein